MSGSAAAVKTMLGRGWRRLKNQLSKPRESLEIGLGEHVECCHDEGCGPFAGSLYEKLAGGRYDWPASILLLDDQDSYLAEHRTARKRAAHSRRLGYVARPIDRSQHSDEIYAINTSLPERQGKRMIPAYRERREYTKLPAYRCRRHRVDEWGVVSPDGILIAYLVLYLCGEVMMISMILGHGDHLHNDIMYLLVLDALEHVPVPVTVFYNRHDFGTEGLRYFKERLGFRPTRVKWVL